jgi:prepilin-type N-terminal cleavage/methylation domain-containing protein
MFFNKKAKGFTLIELLVVIAIIGILSSVVLASLNSARGKGEAARTKAQLSQVRVEGELTYDDNTPGSYAGVCADIIPLLSGLPGDNPGENCAVGTNDGSYSAWGMISATDWWCVDSTGASQAAGSTEPTGAVCS